MMIVISDVIVLPKRVAKSCGICTVLHTKSGVTRSYLVVYYPCCGDVDIDQL